MPYVTSFERHGIEKGRIEGLIESIEVQLEQRFGQAGLALLPLIRKIDDPPRLKELQKAILAAASVEEIGNVLT